MLLVPTIAWGWCEDWTRADTNTALVFSSVVAADIYTTHRVLQEGGYETNPMVGEYPRDSELILWGSAAIGAYVLSACLLPSTWRDRWGWFLVGVELGASLNNTVILVKLW